jgi:acyl-CoA thioesterase II
VPDLWSDLLACLELSQETSRAADRAIFEGRNQALEYHRAIDSQLLRQFIRIASTMCPDKHAESQHAIFTREGRADGPIHYQATRNHDGRSFAALTVTAPQSCGSTVR